MMLIYNNNSNGSVCFVCIFVNGTIALGCVIEYQSTTSHFNGNFTIFKKDMNKCVDNILTDEYNISVYDIEEDGSVFANTPAYQICCTFIIGKQQLAPLSSILTFSSEYYDKLDSTIISIDFMLATSVFAVTTTLSNIAVLPSHDLDQQKMLKPESMSQYHIYYSTASCAYLNFYNTCLNITCSNKFF